MSDHQLPSQCRIVKSTKNSSQLLPTHKSKHLRRTIANIITTDNNNNNNNMSLETPKSDEANSLLDEEGQRPATTANHKATSSRKHHAWITLTALNTFLACITLYPILFHNGRCNSQVQGWDTELADARGAIQYERRSYTGALTYSHDKGGVTRLNDGEMEFFGPPSASVDEAWEYLLHGMLTIPWTVIS